MLSVAWPSAKQKYATLCYLVHTTRGGLTFNAIGFS